MRVIFEDPSGRQKAQQQGQQRFGKRVAKPSGPSGRNDGSQVHEINKWGLEEVNGLKEAQKERNSIPIGSICCRKVRMGYYRPKSNANKESKGLMASP